MRGNKAVAFGPGWASCLVLALAATAPAASPLSNALTGFTGVSNQVATQMAVGAVGLEFASTAGLAPDGMSDPTVAFDANGAAFGALFAANEGRNYMRTIEADYAFVDWVAEVTIVVDPAGTTPPLLDDTWFGMGSGDITNWGTPDWFGVPGVFMAPQVNEAGQGQLSSNATDGITGDWVTPPPCTQGWCSTPAPELTVDAGTHRLRMTFDFDTKTWVGSIDVDYAGGAFVADGTTLTYTLTDMFDDGAFIQNGWPTNPSKIYFGGDDGVIFKDFVVTVPSAGVPGDYNNDGNVDSADYVLWRKDPASFGGNPDGYNTWRTNFGTTTGGGSSFTAGGVPEPTSMVLLLGLLIGTAVGRGVRIG